MTQQPLERFGADVCHTKEEERNFAHAMLTLLYDDGYREAEGTLNLEQFLAVIVVRGRNLLGTRRRQRRHLDPR